MQTTSSGYRAVVNSSYRPIGYSLLVSWLKTLVTGIVFFTIDGPANTSVQATPGTAVDDATVGTTTWTNPSNGKVSDDVYATAVLGFSGNTSDYLKMTNFGFAVPAGSTINGIKVEFERKTAGVITDNSIRLVKAGVISGDDKSAGAAWAASDTYDAFGGSSDLWGLSLTATDVNDATFGVVLSAKQTGGFNTASVDSVRMTVYYLPSAGASTGSLIGGSDILMGNVSSVSYFDKYLYSDYSPYVKNWSIDRKIGQYPFGLIMAQADVELDNSSKIFIPNYDATIGSGILPGRPIKIATSMGQADTFQQFMGFTGAPEQNIVGRSMLLHAYDVIDTLNNYVFTSFSGTTFSGMLTNITTASAIAYYLGKIGFNTSQYALDASLLDVVPFVNVTDKKFGEVLSDIMTAEQGIFFADESGIPRFWNKQHFLTTSGTRAFAFDYGNTINIDYANAPIINDVKVTAMPRRVQVKQSVYTLTTATLVRAGTTTIVNATFSDENGSLPVTSVTTPTYSASPISNSYYSTNANADGSGAALNANISITTTYLYGAAYNITFNNSGTQDVYITAMDLWGTPATVTNTIETEYTDQASIDAYGRNPANNGDVLLISNDYVQSSSAALAIAFSIVSQYKTANRHFSVEVFSNPALQIGDYGTLTLPDTGQTKTVWITGKTDKLAPTGDLTQQLLLEERTLFTYFTINVSTIGGTDVIAP